jgi:phosphate transport system substrate-binding protein
MNTEFRSRSVAVVSLRRALSVTFAALALLFAIGCNYSEDGKPPADPTFATTQIRTFSAAGSTFVAPLMSRWSNDYEKAHNVRVNYRSIARGFHADDPTT